MQLDKLRGKELDQLFTAIMKMDSLEDCYTLFEDLATVNEIQALAQRLEVARQLREGNTYHKIEKATGASTATISRVKRCLNYGSGGYDLALARLGLVEEETADN